VLFTVFCGFVNFSIVGIKVAPHSILVLCDYFEDSIKKKKKTVIKEGLHGYPREYLIDQA